MLKRLYHSSSHIGSNTIINNNLIESKIFNNAIKLIPKYGFSKNCINESIKNLKYSDSLQSIISWQSDKSYEFQLMLYFLKQKRQELENFTKNTKVEGVDEYEKLSKLIKYRLSLNSPIINELSQGMSQLILPYNLNESIDELYNLSDDLAFYSGDKSHSFDWYAKRFTIGSIYVKSELFMLNDTSENFENTQEFVDKKIDEFKMLSDTYNNIEQWAIFNGISLINLIKSQLIRG
ncbi:unnamed protein product [Candida verbasci]|uniref:Ubiquinone biosynthesis protein n=1 Tax=Candida verbasci TaxID=1227364 RepID=A0A9W4TTE0_9ASCO|nr:unnamed protein product [Candida verbasci]